MHVRRLRAILREYPDDHNIVFSCSSTDDTSNERGERWFAEDGVQDYFENDAHELVLCLNIRPNFERPAVPAINALPPRLPRCIDLTPLTRLEPVDEKSPRNDRRG